jgi:hypothetical protein
MSDIFISYSAKDEKLTEIIKSQHLNNFPTWSMRDIDP